MPASQLLNVTTLRKRIWKTIHLTTFWSMSNSDLDMLAVTEWTAFRSSRAEGELVVRVCLRFWVSYSKLERRVASARSRGG